MTDKFTVEFKISSDYKFSGWQAYSKSSSGSLSELSSEYIKFSSYNTESADGIFKTEVEFLKEAEGITIRPLCVLLPKITSITPAMESSGCDQDTAIVINFNKSVNAESFGSWTCVSISSDGEDLSSFFDTPFFSSDAKSLCITPLGATHNEKLILAPDGSVSLKNITVEFPLGKLILITGVSGSGKSTLINETLQPILSQHFYRSLKRPMPYESIEGLNLIDKVVDVDQSPLGRTPRSNPATYTGVFSDIRTLFVGLPEAKIRGYKPGRFSFNVKGGRCETCGGNGYKTIEMNFLPDIQVPCEECHGKRYNRETLEVRYKGKSIADVLDMTINQAVEFFENVPEILRKIKTIQDVGLGYIKLGQPSTTLSGGESQRVKLATELSKRDTGKTVYILDEPTTGLHFEDIRILMQVLRRLVDRGNTVIVIEHNLDVIRQADWIIDMGPEGGRRGGEVLTVGTPEEVAMSQKGYTPRFLKQELGI